MDQVGIETYLKREAGGVEEDVLKETLVESLVETDGEPDSRTARIVGNPNFHDDIQSTVLLAKWHQLLKFGSLRCGRVRRQRQTILSSWALGNIQVGMTGLCLVKGNIIIWRRERN